MTAEPTSTDRHGANGHIDRHPVRVDTDGDFALEDLLALPNTGPARTISAGQAAQALLWRLDPADGASLTITPRPGGNSRLGSPTRDDGTLLHTIETRGLFRPPVHERIARLTPALGAAWLALAAHWVELAQSCGDLRYLNAACKLTGAVWLHHQRAGIEGVWSAPELTGQLAAVGRQLAAATERLQQSLAQRVLLAEPHPPGGQARRTVRLTSPGRARIVVLAGIGSRSAGRLITAAIATGLPITAVCWYGPPRSQPAVASHYASAWYPLAQSDLASAPPLPDNLPATMATTWDEAGAAIRGADADLALLVGMPIVPADVLEAARLGFLNAHNGALPGLRGMDAVGWALLHNQPIVCSLHLARPEVDAGEIIAALPVPAAPVATLAARVKTTQLRLLLAGAAHVATTGALPDLTPQPAEGTQFYRLHPHLKRVLDASPYAHDDHPQWTVIQP